MTDYIEDSIELEFEEIFNDWYEIESVRKIKELSRQLRTFFNYKAQVIKYRYRTKVNPIENELSTVFNKRKKEFEGLTHELILLINQVKKNGHSLKESIQILFHYHENKQTSKLNNITEKLFIILHHFSEENLQIHPKFLRFTMNLADHLCIVKSCLNAQFRGFFEELENNYSKLKEELDELIKNTTFKKKYPHKELEERLLS